MRRHAGRRGSGDGADPGPSRQDAAVFELIDEECVACNLCVIACPVDGCITMKSVPAGTVDTRTGAVVEGYANWTRHASNPLAQATRPRHRPGRRRVPGTAADPAVDPGRVADRPRIAAPPAGRGRRRQMDGQDVRDVVPPRPDGRGEQPQEPDREVRLRATVIACLARELASLASRHPSRQETSPASHRRRCLAISGGGPGDS